MPRAGVFALPPGGGAAHARTDFGVKMMRPPCRKPLFHNFASLQGCFF